MLEGRLFKYAVSGSAYCAFHYDESLLKQIAEPGGRANRCPVLQFRPPRVIRESPVSADASLGHLWLTFIVMLLVKEHKWQRRSQEKANEFMQKILWRSSSEIKQRSSLQQRRSIGGSGILCDGGWRAQ